MLKVLFSNVRDGNMGLNVNLDVEVAWENRERFLSRNGLDHKKTFFMGCSHGTNIGLVNQVQGVGPFEMDDMDGFITFDPEISLAFAPADCMPIVFSCVDSAETVRGIALAHAGLKGLTSLIAAKIVREIDKAAKQKGIDKYRLDVNFLNYIKTCCYHEGLDLMTIGMLQVGALLNSCDAPGFSECKIHPYGDPVCTCCTKDGYGGYEYFSHSRSYNSMKGTANYPHLDTSPEGRNLVAVSFSV
ncbi:laccase domain-containing protein [Patescibacteria group bacterium]